MLVVAMGYVLLRQLPGSRAGRGVFLRASTSKSDGFVAADVRDDLVGHEGVALTDLRPSGTVTVNGERLDVVSEVGFISKGSRVRIIRSEAYRHVVEPV